jgi:crossover junction endodeoxyribonuclease RuvC
MRIIGIDPGTVSTGYGVVEEKAPGRLAYIESGVIASSPKSTLPGRLKKIHDELTRLFELHRPSAVVIEDTFVAKNAQAALKLGQARGVVLLAAETFGLPAFEYTPTQVKSSVVGYGGAGKDQVQRMVARLLESSPEMAPGPATSHASDALACAICHINSVKVGTLMFGGTANS